MKVKKISFPIPLKDVENIYDDNIDVFVTLENGRSYTVIVGTYQNILSLLNQENSNFLPPGEPIIMVRKLTMAIIEEAIQAYATCRDAHWLKLYHFATFIEPSMFDTLEKSEDAGFIELDELDNECKNL
jgi:hypothetical protein